MKFDFITDEKFRNLLERDYEELMKCLETKSSKSVLILSGSIIEAILTDYFLNFPPEKHNEKKILSSDLYKLIELAKENELISQSTKELSTVLKNYRNLIHPGREIRKNESFDFDTAVVAKSLVNIIIKEIRENYLNNIGYSANDLISKLGNDALSETIFEKLLLKVHKSEKSKLFNILIDNELDNTPFSNEILNPKKYINILKSQVEREVVDAQLKKLINKIETGEQWEVIMYYDILHQEINYLAKDEIELVLLYILNAFIELSNDKDQIRRFNRLNLFSSFGTHLTSETVKLEFLKLICKVVYNYEEDKYEYFGAYDQLINSVASDKKEKIKEYVLNNVSSYFHEPFYEKYANGDYLPF
ncbi:hypothetical protein [Tenacibaculum soleae]|uniref:hypothetical protein n=1 Tax=Tenacibaculum soleae TaxID=447689 RepID=UPI0026E3562C|nr:hypothetical protein [Tenacibaculum soleae]MDO6813998.1 hypothetical protein [Tenacibaculum soleae]